jgi:hypothetical protein
MDAKSTVHARLCPQCANSIDEDAIECPYCKTDLFPQSVPQWLKRDESGSESRIVAHNRGRLPIPSKFLWPAGMVVVAVIAFFAGSYAQRSQLSLSTEAHRKQLQARDQMMQSQEAQLAQFRRQLDESAHQLAETKSQLEESHKELATARQRLTVANREIDRLNATRSAPVRRTAARAPDTAPALPPARRAAEPGVYETTRATTVHEGPSPSSRVISQVPGGTRLNVVSSAGDWLEVRSRHGNPPGYVRSDDARLIARAH